MDISSNTIMLIVGVLLMLIGIWIRRRVARYNLQDMVTDSFWQLIRGRRTAETPTDIEHKLSEFASTKSVSGKARYVTGSVVGHFFGQIMNIVALILILGGIVLLLLGYFIVW